MTDEVGLELSFVIPAYNEADNLEPLCRRIEKLCGEIGIDCYEIVFVENGSVDESEKILRCLHQKNPRIKMVQLSRNFGYQGGISAGLTYALGTWVVVMDGDQQDPPELIPEMLRKAKQGYDVIYGIRAKRQDSFLKKLAYKAFYRLWRATAQIIVPLDAGDFCVMHRKVVDCINAMPERQRFIRGLRTWSGFRQAGVSYERPSRKRGDTKFNLGGMIGLALDGLLSYSVAPLRFMTISGFLVASLSFVVGTAQAIFRILNWLGIATVPGILPPGLTQINLLVTFLLGFNILCIGIVGEYIGRIYEEVKQRPIFVVKARLPEDQKVQSAEVSELKKSRFG